MEYNWARFELVWLDNASRILWRRPPDVGVLIRTLPTKLWTEGGKSSRFEFTRPPSDSDFGRLQYYAPMIRVIHLGQYVTSQNKRSKLIAIDEDVFSTLEKFATKSGKETLLPNLTAAVIVFDSNSDFFAKASSHLRCLLSPKVTSLTIKPSTTHRNALFLTREARESLVILISNSCPKITSLTLNASLSKDTDQEEDLLTALLPHLGNLQRINTPVLSPKQQTFERLGALSTFQHLDMLHIRKDTDLSCFKNGFPSLTGLKFTADNWGSVASLLSCFHCPFQMLDITLIEDYDEDDEELPTSQDLERVIAIFKHNATLAKSLKRLIITDTREHELYAELPRSTFQPLLELHALRHLTLHITDLEHLDDDWLTKGALAWPDMETLNISAVDNRFSLKALIPILHNCRKIKTLELHPTASAFDLSLLPADGSVSNPHIKGKFSLHKVEADKMNPEALFSCIKAMFPNVTGVERADIVFGKDFQSCDEDEDEYGEKWEALEGLFKKQD
ncbi:hypothetical protein H0H92_002053 [Tricholoma furcatifolium]|nr:hypothetical protein H0H92_002053 [Tricholoma furcatifolium]